MKIRVLVVEDKLSDLKRCVKLLRRMRLDMKIYQAESGGKAHDIISNENIDAALIDIEMPGIDGFELAYRMRKSNKTRLSPIVFITATENDTIEAYRSYHHDGYIQKPYTEKEFFEVMIPFIKGVIAQKDEREIPRVTFEIISEEHDSNIVKVALAVDDILYIETINRTPNVVTFDAAYKVKKTNLKKIISEINDKDFVQCQRKCYVNINKIFSIREITYKANDIYFTKDGSIKCPLSYSYRNNVMKLLDQENR